MTSGLKQGGVFGEKSVHKLIISSNRISDFFVCFFGGFVGVFCLFCGFLVFIFVFFVCWNKNISGRWVSACPEGLKTTKGLGFKLNFLFRYGLIVSLFVLVPSQNLPELERFENQCVSSGLHICLAKSHLKR